MALKEDILKTMVLHRRGIMGTLIFHLFLLIFLLSMELSKAVIHTEIEIEVAAADPKKQAEEKVEEERKQAIREKTSDEEVERMLRSLAVNENVKEKSKSRETKVEEYIDEIMEELDAGVDDGRYKAVRDKNYEQDSLQNERDKKEQTLDSLKSTFYSGESSVSYNLKERYARFLPIPVFKCETGGTVVVEIVVNRRGAVQKASVVEGKSQQDDCLWDVAVDAARRSRFNEKSSAAAMQEGTITYHFVKQ